MGNHKKYLHITGVPEGGQKENGSERFIKEIMAENFPSLGKETDPDQGSLSSTK